MAIAEQRSVDTTPTEAADAPPTADTEKAQGAISRDADSSTASLPDAFAAWRGAAQQLAGDMVGVAAAEGKLAIVSLVQLLVGALTIASVLTLALVCLEATLAVLLYAAQMPLVAIALLLLVFNLCIALVVYQSVKSLPADFRFAHTRRIMTRSSAQNDEPVDRDSDHA